MTSFLQNGAPVFAAVAGLLLLVWGPISGRGGEVFLIPGSILFGSAVIAAQLAKRSEQDRE